MPSFPLLDIAIGLVFIYLLLSLVCSSLNEGLESLLRNRAIDLEAGIRNLLGDERGKWWASFLPWINSIEKQSITREFYSHPLIRNLFQTENKLPNYIPARNFALAVMDMAVKDGALLRGATNNPARSASPEPEFVEKVNAIPLPARLKDSIEALVRAADNDAQQARINIENWFNNSMERVSGWYKSRTQKILFTIGVAVTILVNADSIAIFRNLSHSKNLQSVVNAAQSMAAKPQAASPNPQAQFTDAMNQLTSLDVGVGWASEREQSGALDRGKLPPALSGTGCKIETWPCDDRIGWSLHLLYLHGIGWLITAAAISLGAPFWFDVLGRFITVRSTIKPKPQEENATDSTAKPQQ